jgi:hypothetical protein
LIRCANVNPNNLCHVVIVPGKILSPISRRLIYGNIRLNLPELIAVLCELVVMRLKPFSKFRMNVARCALSP